MGDTDDGKSDGRSVVTGDDESSGPSVSGPAVSGSSVSGPATGSDQRDEPGFADVAEAKEVPAAGDGQEPTDGAEVLISCPSCGEEVPEEAKFCEACGHDLNSVVLPACVACGEREVAEEGYCLSCGHKQPEERDHMVFRDGPAVAATDRGKRHRHNEDAVAIATTADGVAVLVVCDGVSSTSGSAEASLRAANAARDLLVLGLTAGDDVGTDGPTAGTAGDVDSADRTAADRTAGDDGAGDQTARDVVPDTAGAQDGGGSTVVAELLARAAEAAQVEASASAGPGGDGELGEDGVTAADLNPAHDGGSPSSTFVAVVAEPRGDAVVLTTAWIGDSRAYWIGPEPQQLTGKDHELGGSLVRWLGADTINATPDVVSVVVDGPGHVVVCSDGLWRYAADVGELSELVDRLVGDGSLGVDLATDMVSFANDSGGHDNITVALWTNAPELAGRDDGRSPGAEPAGAEPPSDDEQNGEGQ